MERNEEKLNEWRAFFKERKERKLTIKEFCQEKNITPAQFYYYQGIINHPEKSQPPKAQKNYISNIKPIQIVKRQARQIQLFALFCQIACNVFCRETCFFTR